MLEPIEGWVEASLLKVSASVGGNIEDLFKAAIDEFLQNGTRYLILEFDTLTDISSSALGLLVPCAEKLKQRGGAVAVINLSGKVKIVIEMLGLNAIFLFFADLETAKKKLVA
jgi:anti-anti-sigma factor